MDSSKSFQSSFENGTTVLPPRITSSRSRGYVVPSRRKPPPADGEEEERITNQKKQRYWNSYEEMYIVELWRRYNDEITEFNKPLPAHRKIMVAMRAKDMMVTGQDCRRKINTLNNKYKVEAQRIRLNGGKSDWRLFPLIHCIMEPKVKQFDAWHEIKVVNKLLEQMPKPPEMKIAPALLPAVATPTPVPTTVRKGQQQCRDVPFSSNVKGYLPSSLPHNPLPINSKIPTYTSDNISNSQSLAFNKKYFMHSNISSHTGAKSNLPFRDITFQKYQQIKLNNEILAEQRETSLKRLRLEEEGFKIFESILIDLKEQTRAVLETIESLKESSLEQNMSTNPAADVKANNGHMEQDSSGN